MPNALHNPQPQLTDTVLMIRPARFGFNPQTAASNRFQREHRELSDETIQMRALQEFEHLRATLAEAHLNVLVLDDTVEPRKPDSIFPNNWLSCHADGTIVVYPMAGENRRNERRRDIIEALMQRSHFKRLIDLTGFEHHGLALEGTGSMVLDRTQRTVYACLSTRTDKLVLREFARHAGLTKIMPFRAWITTNEETGLDRFHLIYHTNVMMALGEHVAVICAESITHAGERHAVLESLTEAGKTVVEITVDQMRRFAGNMLQLKSARGERFWVMSSNAFSSLSNGQREALTQDGSRIIHAPLDTIELVGGGSARCMLAEIHHPS